MPSEALVRVFNIALFDSNFCKELLENPRVILTEHEVAESEISVIEARYPQTLEDLAELIQQRIP
jgi:hypothetical protein